MNRQANVKLASNRNACVNDSEDNRAFVTFQTDKIWVVSLTHTTALRKREEKDIIGENMNMSKEEKTNTQDRIDNYHMHCSPKETCIFEQEYKIFTVIVEKAISIINNSTNMLYELLSVCNFESQGIQNDFKQLIERIKTERNKSATKSNKLQERNKYSFKVTIPGKTERVFFLPHIHAATLIDELKTYFSLHPKELELCDEVAKKRIKSKRPLHKDEFIVHLRFWEQELHDFGMDLVKQKMEEQNISSYFIARLLNISESYVCKILNNKITASYDIAVKFAEILDIDYRVFLFNQLKRSEEKLPEAGTEKEEDGWL